MRPAGDIVVATDRAVNTGPSFALANAETTCAFPFVCGLRLHPVDPPAFDPIFQIEGYKRSHFCAVTAGPAQPLFQRGPVAPPFSSA